MKQISKVPIEFLNISYIVLTYMLRCCQQLPFYVSQSFCNYLYFFSPHIFYFVRLSLHDKRKETEYDAAFSSCTTVVAFRQVGQFYLLLFLINFV